MAIAESPIFGRSQWMFPNAGTLLTNTPSKDYGTGALLASQPQMPSGYGTGAMLTDVSKLPEGYGTGEFLKVAPAASTLPSTMMTAGMLVSAFGAINSAIGSYFSAESQKTALKMQAQNQKFASQMAAINARGAEFSAQTAMEAGQRAIGRYTMQAGQARASSVAAMAARGIQGGVGSAKEIMASMDLINEIDRLTMSANTVRQAEAYRTQAMNYAIQSKMEGLSAQNLASTAGSISPAMSAYGSLLGSTADIGASWLRSKRFEEMLGGVSTKRFG